jgi:hypothetical protein
MQFQPYKLISATSNVSVLPTMPPSIIPFARSLFLCEHHIGYSTGKVDLYGIFNFHRSERGFPLRGVNFCVFAQLSHGLGKVPFHFDIRHVKSNRLIRTTDTKVLDFSTRSQIVQLAMSIENCHFEWEGVYLVELYCGDTWLCDARLELR